MVRVLARSRPADGKVNPNIGGAHIFVRCARTLCSTIKLRSSHLRGVPHISDIFPIIFSSFFRAHLHGVPNILFVFVVRGCVTDVWWLGWSVGRSVVLGESVGRSYNQPLVMGLADVSQGLAPRLAADEKTCRLF